MKPRLRRLATQGGGVAGGTHASAVPWRLHVEALRTHSTTLEGVGTTNTLYLPCVTPDMLRHCGTDATADSTRRHSPRVKTKQLTVNALVALGRSCGEARERIERGERRINASGTTGELAEQFREAAEAQSRCVCVWCHVDMCL